MNKNNIRIVARVSEKEHELIKKKAEKLRLSVSEFIRKRVLDYELKSFPSNAYFTLCEKVEGLIANPNSPRFKQEVIDCLDIISEELWR